MWRLGAWGFVYFFKLFILYWGIADSLVTQLVKNLPAMQETLVRFLGWEDPLEEGMATHSSIFAWRIPWTEKPGRLQSVRLQRIGHNWSTAFQVNSEGTWSYICVFSVIQSCSTLCNPLGLQPTRLLCPWDFPGKNTAMGCPFPSLGDLPKPGIKFGSPALAGRFFTTEPPGKP